MTLARTRLCHPAMSKDSATDRGRTGPRRRPMGIPNPEAGDSDLPSVERPAVPAVARDQEHRTGRGQVRAGRVDGPVLRPRAARRDGHRAEYRVIWSLDGVAHGFALRTPPPNGATSTIGRFQPASSRHWL